jgi:hypothetical protein
MIVDVHRRTDVKIQFIKINGFKNFITDLTGGDHDWAHVRASRSASR